MLIAFEGIDGTGKSTQISMLAGYLEGKGFDVVQTREPTDGPYGQKIRSLFEKRHHLTPEEELGLFMDDRRQHVRDLIIPALGEGQVVLTDRYYFSTAAYQGAAGHDPDVILAENEVFAPEPDLVLLLTLSPAEGIHRIMNMRGEELNDFEKEDVLKKVAVVFDNIKKDYIARVDASLPPANVHREVVNIVERLLAGKNGEAV